MISCSKRMIPVKQLIRVETYRNNWRDMGSVRLAEEVNRKWAKVLELIKLSTFVAGIGNSYLNPNTSIANKRATSPHRVVEFQFVTVFPFVPRPCFSSVGGGGRPRREDDVLQKGYLWTVGCYFLIQDGRRLTKTRATLGPTLK